MRERRKFVFAAGVLAALAAGWLLFPRAIYERRAQPVEFSHKAHTEAGGMKCEGCHEFRADGTFSGIPRLEKCAGCHAAAMGTTRAEKHFLEAYATPQREVPWAIYARQPENVYFSHTTHVKLAHLACESCHGSVGKSSSPAVYEQDRISGYSREVWERMKMDDCVACHRQHGLEHSCLDCHK